MQALAHKFLHLVSGRSDIVLAVMMVTVIFMMILPLPTALIDALIAMNMGVAVILLMVAVYLTTPLDFSSFPSVLLITTLFRLALSISTTRLILLQADAGEIVFTFGNFVVGGNLVVGIVVFLILTIVQFVVITKGAERVAEVSARFSLDAMPGKQISIDGDMRAGLIDIEEARRRRSNIEKESQLFGSMDGAMKFVKGDAIAGLIIVAVNMVGGITIGVVQNGLSAAEAAHVYSILTIGDGLIAQIPGLFIAITSGLIVTRVTSEEKRDLGSDIIIQIANEPRSLLVASGLMLGFALIPGFPSWIFILLATALGLPVWLSTRKKRAEAMAKEGKKADASAPDVSGRQKTRIDDQQTFSLTSPLLIDVASSMQKAIDSDNMNDQLIRARRALYFDLGVPFPGIKLRFSDQVPEGEYVILFQEVPVTRGYLRSDKLFSREKPENLKLFHIDYEEDKGFLPNLDTIWVPQTSEPVFKKAGLSYMKPAEILIYHLSFVLKRHAESFIGIQETYFLLNNMEEQFPDLVKEIQRVLPLQKVAEILKRLVSEGVSIRNMRTVLEALIEWGQKEKDSVLLTEYVRIGLGRQISYQFSGGQNILPAYLLDSAIEEKVRGAIRQTSSGSYLALDPQSSHQFVDAVKAMVGNVSEHSQSPVLVTATDIRRYVRKLIELEVYELPVLAYQELTQEITIQPLGKISIDEQYTDATDDNVESSADSDDDQPLDNVAGDAAA